MQSTKNFELPNEISSVITVHKWKNFALHPQNPIFPLVHKFYSNILTGAQTFSMVRGVKVSFSAPTINMHLGLDNVVDEYSPLFESISVQELTRVLNTLAIEGTNWLPDKGDGIFMCSRPAF